jgi:hypothetical protein
MRKVNAGTAATLLLQAFGAVRQPRCGSVARQGSAVPVSKLETYLIDPEAFDTLQADVQALEIRDSHVANGFERS